MTFNAVGTSVGARTNQASVTSAQIELTPADNVVVRNDAWSSRSCNCAVPSFSGPVLYLGIPPTGDVLSWRPERRWIQGSGRSGPLGQLGRGVSRQRDRRRSRRRRCIRRATARTKACIARPERRRPARPRARRASPTRSCCSATAPAGSVRRRRSATRRPSSPTSAPATSTATAGRTWRSRHFGPNQLHMRLNNGNGGFVETATPIALPGAAGSHRRPGSERRRRPDLALSYTTFNGSQPAGQVSILIGDGAGGFIMPANLALPLQAGSRDARVRARRHQRRRNPRPRSHRDTGRHPPRAALLRQRRGRVHEPAAGRSVPGAFRMIAGDVNGDGRQDLAVSTGNIASRLPRQRRRRIRPADAVLDAVRAAVRAHGSQRRRTSRHCRGHEPGRWRGGPVERLRPADRQSRAECVRLARSGRRGRTGDLFVDGDQCRGQPGDECDADADVVRSGSAGTASSSQGACTISGNRLVTCNLGPLAPNASADVQVTFTPSVGETLSSVDRLSDRSGPIRIRPTTS